MNPKLPGVIATFTALGALLSYWPHLQPVLDWVLVKLGWLVLQRQFQAFIVAIAVGTACSWFVPHYLPSWFEGKDTRMRMGLYNSALVFAIAWKLETTFIGFWIAVFAGMVGWPTAVGLVKAFYSLMPKNEPASLKTTPTETQAPTAGDARG